MISIFIVMVVVLTVSVSAQSSNSPQTKCPAVSVTCFGKNGCEQPYSFLATVNDADPAQKISFEWTVINGHIVSGQGSSLVKVLRNQVTKTVYRDGKLVTELRNQGALTASVKLIGAPPECDRISAASMSVITEEGMVPPPKVIEEFGNISFKDVKPRLDSFAQQLQNHPGAMGYIISDGRWRYAKRAMDYLVTTMGIESGRLKYVPKNTIKRFVVKLYIVPARSVPPS